MFSPRVVAPFALGCFVGGGATLTFWAWYRSNGYFIMRADGESMLPTITSDDFMLNRDVWQTPKFRGFRRGDVIMVKRPLDALHTTEHLAKRIVGLPGDISETRPPDAPWSGTTKDPDCDEPFLCQVPPKRLWVEGDNHAVRMNSNTLGLRSAWVPRSSASFGP